MQDNGCVGTERKAMAFRTTNDAQEIMFVVGGASRGDSETQKHALFVDPGSAEYQAATKEPETIDSPSHN